MAVTTPPSLMLHGLSVAGDGDRASRVHARVERHETLPSQGKQRKIGRDDRAHADFTAEDYRPRCDRRRSGPMRRSCGILRLGSGQASDDFLGRTHHLRLALLL